MAVTFNGGGGNDVFTSGNGNDMLHGNAGATRHQLRFGQRHDRHRRTGIGDQVFTGGDGVDIIIGAGGNNIIIGGTDTWTPTTRATRSPAGR